MRVRIYLVFSKFPSLGDFFAVIGRTNSASIRRHLCRQFLDINSRQLHLAFLFYNKTDIQFALVKFLQYTNNINEFKKSYCINESNSLIKIVYNSFLFSINNAPVQLILNNWNPNFTFVVTCAHISIRVNF